MLYRLLSTESFLGGPIWCLSCHQKKNRQIFVPRSLVRPAVPVVQALSLYRHPEGQDDLSLVALPDARDLHRRYLSVLQPVFLYFDEIRPVRKRSTTSRGILQKRFHYQSNQECRSDAAVRMGDYWCVAGSDCCHHRPSLAQTFAEERDWHHYYALASNGAPWYYRYSHSSADRL